MQVASWTRRLSCTSTRVPSDQLLQSGELCINVEFQFTGEVIRVVLAGTALALRLGNERGAGVALLHGEDDPLNQWGILMSPRASQNPF